MGETAEAFRATVLSGLALGIDASASSQFVSGLLLAAPVMPLGIELSNTADTVPSRAHVDMTIEVLRDAGVDISEPEPERWIVEPGLPRGLDVQVEPDLSNAAAFAAAAVATSGSVTIADWPVHTTQAGDGFREITSADAGLLRGGQRRPDGRWLATIPAESLTSLRVVDRAQLHELLASALAPGSLRPGHRVIAATAEGRVTHAGADGAAGATFVTGDAEDLAARTLELLADRPRLRVLSELGRRRARDFDWEVVAEEIIAVYDTVIAAGSSSRWPPRPRAELPRLRQRRVR